MAFELAAQSIVVVGEFNRAIIRPKWLVKQAILPEGGVQAKLTDRPGAPTSFRFAMFDWEVGPTKLIIKPLAPEMPDPGSVMAKILQILQHTPISALGHNFLYSAPLDDASQLPGLGSSSARDVARMLRVEEPTSTTWSMLVKTEEGHRAEHCIGNCGPGAPTSFRFAMFDWEVRPTKLIIKPLAPEMPDPGSVMAKILQILQHTPISALGHNFLYSAPLDDASQLPGLGSSSARDVARMLRVEEPTSTTWSMLVKTEEGHRLGVTIRAEPPNQKADVNFHFDCADASEAVAAAGRVNEMRDRAKEIVDKIGGAK